MNRRRFLRTGAAGAVGWLAVARRAAAQAQSPAQAPAAPAGGIPYGETALGMADPDDEDQRDGLLYVPKSYRDGVPMPLLVMLHGLGGGAAGVRYTFPLAEEFGVIVLAPDSRRFTWGRDAPGFDRDSVFIVDAMKYVNRTVYMDPAHVAIGGVSDGATYALTMGLVYGDPSFTHIMVFSEGIPNPQRKQGKPKIFIGHGTQDTQMPIDITSRRFVPEYKKDGYDVTYREYDGGHGAPRDVVRDAFVWFTGKTPATA
jgi:predicted esterase